MADSRRTIEVRDFETGEVRSLIGDAPTQIQKLALSPDGQTLASASADKTVRLWRAGTASGANRRP